MRAFLIPSLLLLLSLTFTPDALRAQSDPDARAQMEAARKATLERMAPMKWMLGEWEGPATLEYAPGQKLTLTQRETVTEGAFGTAMLVQGRGTMSMNGADRLVFDAAGLLSYDLRSNRFFFASTAGTGGVGSHEITVDGSTVTWYLDDGSGNRTRYVIRHTAEGWWHETGEVSHDGGKTYARNFEMLLVRKK